MYWNWNKEWIWEKCVFFLEIQHIYTTCARPFVGRLWEASATQCRIVLNLRGDAAVVRRCGNRFPFIFQVDADEKSSQPEDEEPRFVEASPPLGHHRNAAHHNTRTERNGYVSGPCGVIAVMRLSPWRCPRVTDDSRDRWRTPPAMEITAGSRSDFQEVSPLASPSNADRKEVSVDWQEVLLKLFLLEYFCRDWRKQNLNCRVVK